jgi:hypothetical protein
MTTLEQLDRDCPEHDRDSCSDEHPDNAGVDFRYGHTWCRRCEGMARIKSDAAVEYCHGRGIRFNLEGEQE